MDNEEILKRLNNITPPDNNFLVFRIGQVNCYFGRDNNGHIVFMRESEFENLPSVCQETKSLRFLFNNKCSIFIDGQCLDAIMHVLICKETELHKIEAFIRLSTAFAQNTTNNDPFYFARLFSLLCSLFDKEYAATDIELQGLYSELYTIVYFHNIGCDVEKYWQSQNKMKFDFSIDEHKRIEVKSTLKSSRTHHFKHDQLLSQIYDIKVVSIMMQKNDCGLSLMDLVNNIRTLYPQNFALMYHVDLILSQVGNGTLQGIKYDGDYLKNNIKFYDAKCIPHFNEKSPDGIYNAEYDCALDNAISQTAEEIITWIGDI